jgi:hypothetical protein
VLVRSLFNAYDIPVVISGEHHFTLLPWYVGAFRTDVFVGAADAEDAAALLADSRSGKRTVLDNSGSPGRPTENRDHASDVQPIRLPLHPWAVVATDRWHQAGMALLFGMIAGFGAAHFYYTRAWVRGLALALVQLSATKVLGHSMDALGLVILARLGDVVGALWLFWYGRDEQAAFRWRSLDTAGRELDAIREQEGILSPGADP